MNKLIFITATTKRTFEATYYNSTKHRRLSGGDNE
jgi:hypothetical protein